ncbi:Growth_factor receptor cysteine-rich domain superfamily [Hexamita inflata]|uniref:Growth factor receptor cysteine-rich domain superfamily n=1 Tax=Hexamita inflata TaxID=28002 RepID=A0AA86RRY9_9EUKA|nr:Growth factor receptor cysteine-rich domain superfamily [Hexamita inflata]
MDGNCNCGGGSVGRNTFCEDCWAKSMIVIDNSCVSCSSFDKNAFYNFENICSCFKGLSFVNFRCRWYSSRQQRVIIISSVLSFAFLVFIILFVVSKRRKMNGIEFKSKNIQKEQKLNLVETDLKQTGKVNILTANTTKNEVIIMDEIQNMNLILQEIEIIQIDEIKENEVYLYKE